MSGSRDQRNEMRGCGVVELRRYDLRPGARETLIDLFEREFVETQEAVGIRVLGTFRDVADPHCFVWLRGFEDMTSRLVAPCWIWLDARPRVGCSIAPRVEKGM